MKISDYFLSLILPIFLFCDYQNNPTIGLTKKGRHPQFYQMLRLRVIIESSAENVVHFT